MLYKFFLISAVLLSGCNSSEPTVENSQNDSNRIVGLCGGGFSSSRQLQLSAALNKADLNGEISGDVERDFKAIILSNDGVTTDNITEIYTAFLTCVKQQTGL